MKPVMAWIKANLTIVVLSAAIILVLPAAFVATGMWNKHIRKAREAAANEAYGKLKAMTVSYAFPATTPGGIATTVSMDAPNPVATAFFKQHRTILDGEIAKVGDTAKEINQTGHALLVDGLFVPASEGPKPEDGQPAVAAAPDAPKPGTVVDPFKAVMLAELIVGRPDKPSVYEELLARINAGGPADPIRIHEALNDEQGRFMELIKAQHNRDKPNADEQAELTKTLTKMRLSQYQHRASEISVYATTDALPGDIPKAVPSESPDASACFQMQFDYWLVADLLRAVDAANTDAAGKRTTLDKSMVKRVERIDLLPGAEPSVTGRHNGPDNKLYDVRQARLTLIVSSSGLPALINAVSRTNFMSVIGLDFTEIDPWADLNKGYFYGTDHVVRAVVKIETIWLRSWTEPLMPQAYKDLLTGAPAEGAASMPSAPATSRRGAAMPPEDEGLRGRPKAPRGKSTTRPGSTKGGG